MIKHWIAALAVLLVAVSYHGIASAQTWVICDSCTTEAQFSSSARSAHGSTWGSRLYGVVNPGTGQFLWVQVARATGPRPLASEAEEAGIAPAYTEELRLYSAEGVPVTGILMSSEDPSHRITASRGMTAAQGVTVVPVTPTNEERATVDAIVRISKRSVLFAPGSSMYYTDFHTAYFDYRAALDSLIREVLSANNAVWAADSITSGLWSALQLYFGKGPIGCVVFNNGDVACFQINPLAPGAARVVVGTAKTVDGAPIDTSNGSPIGNGGGIGIEVRPDFPSLGYVTYQPTSLSPTRLACVRVGTDVSHCVVAEEP